MEERIFQFTQWVYANYGWPGALAVMIILIAMIGLPLYFLSRLPEKEEPQPACLDNDKQDSDSDTKPC